MANRGVAGGSNFHNSGPVNNFPNNSAPVNIYAQPPGYVDESEMKKLIDRGKTLIQRHYREHYSTVGSRVPRLPWLKHDPLEEFHVDLELQEMNRSMTLVTKRGITYEDIFKPDDGDYPPRTILILGRAGYGKSTLVTKVAQDWAKRKNSYLANFEAVLIFQLRDLHKHTDLEETIKEKFSEILSERRCNANIDDVYREVMENTLILLDGFDEVSKKVQSSVQRFIRSSLNATVVTTCRPTVDDQSFLNSFYRYVAICELSEISRDKLVDLVFQANTLTDKEGFRRKFIEMSLTDLSPLLLFVFSFVFQNCDNMQNVYFYDLVVSACEILLKRTLEKRNMIVHEEMQHVLISLGGFFWKKLRQLSYEFAFNELQQTFNDSCDVAIEMGILQLKSENLYGPVHKLFMDILSIHYLKGIFSAGDLETLTAFEDHCGKLKTTRLCLYLIDNHLEMDLRFEASVDSFYYDVPEGNAFSDGSFNFCFDHRTKPDLYISTSFTEHSDEYHSTTRHDFYWDIPLLDPDREIIGKRFSVTANDDNSLLLQPEAMFTCHIKLSGLRSDTDLTTYVPLEVDWTALNNVEEHEKLTWKDLEENLPLFHSVFVRMINVAVSTYLIFTYREFSNFITRRFIYIHNPDSGETCDAEWKTEQMITSGD